MRQLAIAVIGVVITLLGILWLLQGTGVLQVCPILCFADCECVRGGSAFWEAAGLIAFIIGAMIAGASWKAGFQNVRKN